MREYIFTDLERSIAKTTLRVGVDVEGASLHRLRARRALPRLEEDLKLLRRLVSEVAPRGRHRKLTLDSLQVGSGVLLGVDEVPGVHHGLDDVFEEAQKARERRR